MPLTVIGEHEERTIRQLERCVAAEPGAAGVLCADGHVGYSQPVGGAVAYREHVSVSGVGYDIGCGNKAVRTNLRQEDIAGDLPRLMDEIVARISFGVGRRNDEPADHPVLDAIRTADFPGQRALLDLAAAQLGTVGAGNHYVDLFADEDGLVWVGVHFGSRGFGHRTASGFLALARGLAFDAKAPGGEMDAEPTLLRADSELGRGYIAAMNLAGDYAYAGRDVVVDRVLEILGASATHSVHNHHNFCIPGDQVVPTTAGPRRMDAIRPGDRVYALDPDGGLEEAEVTDHWCAGVALVHAITLSAARLRCTGSHPVLVAAETLGWRRAADLRPGDRVVCAGDDGPGPPSRPCTQPVASVERQMPAPVYDLTVDHASHSFVAGGVVTHNCWRETHGGEDWWVVRKGCTPAFPGQQGFVGSTMGETSVILEGADTTQARAALFSTVHGAGRRLSRTQAAGKMGVAWECSVRECDFFATRAEQRGRATCPRHPGARLVKRRRRVKPGLIDFSRVRADLAARGIELRGGGADEAPDAYKRLDAVLADHGESVRVVHRLRPIGVAMAGPDTFDPYKD